MLITLGLKSFCNNLSIKQQATTGCNLYCRAVIEYIGAITSLGQVERYRGEHD
jgi:hypothetical protein